MKHITSEICHFVHKIGFSTARLNVNPVLLVVLSMGIFISLAQASSNPDACIKGYVWREAFPGDRVCVTPDVREQADVDNRLSATRMEHKGGVFGPDTCKMGFVWREARPDDHVCVTSEIRTQTARDNREAASRRLVPPAAANGAPSSNAQNGAMSMPSPTTVRKKHRRSAQKPSPKMATKKSRTAMSRSFRLPEFPWPPPPYSTRLKIERPLLVAGQPLSTNGSVAKHMEQALAANGYTQISYYAVPDGFAMVTQIERMNADAASAAEQRWSTRIDPVSLIPFNLSAYVNALLGKNGDSFRVIVFIFTSTPFITSDKPIPPESAMEWVKKGATSLPTAIATRAYGVNTVCNALVYEFRISSLGANLRNPSDFDGARHLRAAGILTTLEQP